MNRPWMPLYIAEYLADTGHLSAAEHGAYMLMIMHYWQKDGLPSDEKQLARICRMSPEEWRESRDTLASFFGDHWSHSRIDAEIAHAEAIIGKRKAAAEQMHNNRAAKADANAHANAEQMQTHAGVSVSVSSLNKEPQSKRVSATPSPDEAQFQRFLLACPKRQGSNPHGKARERFFRAVRVDGADRIIAAADRWKAQEQKLGNEGTRYVPQMEVWLNKAEWRDVDPTPIPINRPPPSGEFIEQDSARWSEIAGTLRQRGKLMPPPIYTLNGRRGAYVQPEGQAA